jgi:hypothetical protein
MIRYSSSIHHSQLTRLTSLVKTKSNNVGVDHAQVEGSEEGVGVGKRNEHGVIDSWVALVDLAGGLVSVTSVLAGNLEGSVGQVELGDPSDVGGGAGNGVSDVGVVGADEVTGLLPGEVYEPAGEGERLRAVVGDGRAARVAGVLGAVDVHAALIGGDGAVSWVGGTVTGDLEGLGVVGREAVGVGLVVNVQSREVLPCETSGVLRARADVGSKVGPLPRLGNTGLEPDRLGVETKHLAERDLLTSLGGDGLGEEVGDLAGVHVGEETPDTRLAPAGDLHVEVDELANSAVGVVVGALGRSSLAEHVGEEGGVTSLLDSHESDVGAVLSSKTSVEEVLLGEDSKTVVEQVKLDPLLVETKGDGLVIEVAVHHVAGLSAVGTGTSSGHVRDGHGILGLAVGVVVSGGGVRWQWRNRSTESGRRLLSSSGGRSSRVRSMTGGASHN